MEGINILNQTEIMEYSYEQHIFYAVSVILLFVSIVVFVVSSIGGYKWLAITGTSLFLICVITLCIVDWNKSKHTGRYKYEVTIDDNVPFTEIYKKYDVVKQKGDIWVLEDKED